MIRFTFLIFFLFFVLVVPTQVNALIDRGNNSIMLEDPGTQSSGGGNLINDIFEILFPQTGSTENETTPPPSGSSTSLSENEPFPQPSVPPTTPNGQEVATNFVALDSLYEYVGQQAGVPQCVIKAISYMEYGTVFNYTAEEINQYASPGQSIPNCPWNQCSAAGHMQMTMGIDDRGSSSCNQCCWEGSCLNYCPNAWSSYGDAVNEYENASHTAKVCNLKDSTFAAAKKLKLDSGSAPGDRDWSQSEMNAAGKSYFGNCSKEFDHLGNKTYCGFIIHECSL